MPKDTLTGSLFPEYNRVPETKETPELADPTDTWSIDVPIIPENGDVCGEMHTVKEFRTRPEAIKFAMDNYNADEDGMISLVWLS